MRLALFVAVPATALFVVLAHPIVVALFQRGAFGPDAAIETSHELIAQGFGLWTVAAVRQLVPVFYALGDTRTPVVISEGIEWAPPERWQETRREFLAAFEQWRADWESLDIDRYLSHSSASFRSDGKDVAAWKAHKRKVNAGKTWVKVGISDLSVFGHPDGDGMFVATFAQDYRSSNLSNRTVKRQYWARDQGRWRVVFETVIS